LAVTGLLGEPADPIALRWHVLSWDPWVPAVGVLLVVAAPTRRRLSRTSWPPRRAVVVEGRDGRRPGEPQVAGRVTKCSPERHADVVLAH